MLDCQIVGLAQDMDFEANVSQTFLVVQLPDGVRVRAAIDDATAEIVVKLQVHARGVPSSSPRQPQTAAPARDDYGPPPGFETVQTEDGTVQVFGGRDDETSDYAEPPEGMMADAPPYADLPIIEDPDPEPVSRAKDKSPKRTARVAAERAAEAARAPKTGKAPPKNLFRTAQGRLVAPSKTIPKNEAGFPIVSGNGVDPEQLTGGRDQDEDGVGSI